MKYARTEYDIVRMTKNFVVCQDFYCAIYDFYEPIVKESENLEDLFDKVIVEHEFDKEPDIMSYYDAQYFIDIWKKKTIEIHWGINFLINA